MRYEGLEPLEEGARAIEVVTPEGTFDLHNFGSIEAIAFEPPGTVTATVRCWEPARARVRLRFDGVDGFSGGLHRDELDESATLAHLIVWEDQVEVWTGSHAFEFTATALSATVEPVFGSAIEPAAFQAAANDCFAGRLGLTATGREGYTARFERPPVFVEVGYDATRSWELDVWLGRADRPHDPIDVADAVEAAGCPRAVVTGLLANQTGEPHVLRRLLARVADALEGCGAALLSEDGAALDRAFELREAQSAEFECAEAAQHVLGAAEEAWAAKDLDRLVVLLAPLRDRLPPRHARRLAFAEKRVDRSAMEAVVRNLVELVARGDYDAVVAISGGVRMSAEDLREEVEEYGYELAAPPADWWERVQVTPIADADPPKYHVAAPLWEPGGESDLTLEVWLTEKGGGEYAVEVLNLHML